MNYFRIHPSIVDDFDATVIRIEKNQMQKLGINEGDTVKITGTKSTGAICYSIEDDFKMPNDSDIIYSSKNAVILPQLRASNFVASNMADHGGAGLIPVSLEKKHSGTVMAKKISLMSLNSGSNTDNFDKSKINKAIVCKNDRFHFRDDAPSKNFGFLVTNVEPTDYSQINKDTEIEFVQIKPDVINSSFAGPKLERLENVIPIVFQTTLENVTVTIPSLEIFDTGIRFYVYLKGNYGENKTFTNGHASVIATLHDDAGNKYALTSKGGGGSSSPMGFELRYEFHGESLKPDTKQLTIAVREIIIQEQFPRPDMRHANRPSRMIRGTKEEYANVGKFPSFFIISGPWQVTFPLNI